MRWKARSILGRVMQPLTLYTIGHSDRTMAELLVLLKDAGITCVVDIRAQPTSARHPQFNMESLRAALAEDAIVYHWAGRPLGGQRATRPDSPHHSLPESLRGFADHMDTDIFAKGVAQLLGLARKAPTAILCAEREPTQCHRNLIADYLVLQGIEVRHLVRTGETREHALSPLARTESARLVYDRASQQSLGIN